ncbi:MAG TPA: hypothetical protein VKK79_08155 [Candidatus Lokiarchaeia archaeon]|nr:hypothetical protein [Candidatus Lokiarchaeia archaeon]
MNELEFPTRNFQETEWGQAADIVVGGTAVGRVEVNYLEARPAEHEGPFLKEERDLIDEIARRLGRATERMWAEAALETMHAEREELEQVVKQKSSLDFDASIATLSPISSIARDKIWHDLNERVKELQCLYALGIIIETADNVEDAFQEFMQYLPPAWQYPEVTCSRVQLNDQFFTTSNFQETGWIQFAPIIVGGNQVGYVEVFYLDEMPAEYEGPFLKEERMLIDEIAWRLGRAAERIWAEEALDVTHEEREELEQKLRRLRAGSQE